MSKDRISTQVLIIGTGLAGCTAALELAEAGFEVLLLSATKDIENGNSSLAQGGIIYSSDPNDHKVLIDDICIAGHYENSSDAVRFLVEKGHESVKEILIDKLQISFEKDKDSKSLSYTKEGGHTNARIIHCHDYTGKAIMQGLYREITKHKNIQILSDYIAIDLITTVHHSSFIDFKYKLKNECLGVYALNNATNEVNIIFAEQTILATGGLGQVYLHSTNNYNSVGSAISMANRANVRLMNMDYVQFHPTTLWDLDIKRQDSQRFLITEAMRGEGAILRTKSGYAFMSDYDSRKDLAPRDIVSNSIVSELLKSGDEFVNLDITNIQGDISKRFPTIYNHCIKHNVDIASGLIPVVPAAHYFCGGILTDINARTNLRRLFAVGECACTGIHGKNRLASTSLLEALLFGSHVAKYIINTNLESIHKDIFDTIPDWENSGIKDQEEPSLIAADWAQIKTIMWNYVGIIRTKKKVRRAFEELRELSKHIYDFYQNTPISSQIIRLFHATQSAYLITQTALRNTKADN